MCCCVHRIWLASVILLHCLLKATTIQPCWPSCKHSWSLLERYTNINIFYIHTCILVCIYTGTHTMCIRHVMYTCKYTYMATSKWSYDFLIVRFVGFPSQRFFNMTQNVTSAIYKGVGRWMGVIGQSYLVDTNGPNYVLGVAMHNNRKCWMIKFWET